MRHCVANYADVCLAGYYRIFTAEREDSGKPLATIGLIRREDRWTVDQVKGPGNRDPGTMARNLARQILLRYQDALRVEALQEIEDIGRRNREHARAEDFFHLMVSRHRGCGLLHVRTAHGRWEKTNPENYPLPAPLLERFTVASDHLRREPFEPLPDEGDWRELDLMVQELTRMLRRVLPHEFRVYVEEAGEVRKLVQ
jgi:hypothetical protein